MSDMMIFACDSEAKAKDAKSFLVLSGFKASKVTVEAISSFAYDATTYDGGASEVLDDKWVVIGRKA